MRTRQHAETEEWQGSALTLVGLGKCSLSLRERVRSAAMGSEAELAALRRSYESRLEDLHARLKDTVQEQI